VHQVEVDVKHVRPAGIGGDDVQVPKLLGESSVQERRNYSTSGALVICGPSTISDMAATHNIATRVPRHLVVDILFLIGLGLAAEEWAGLPSA